MPPALPEPRILSAIRALPLPPTPLRIMEVCGGQTHSILRYALDTLLPPSVTLLHGPGCPVCVTPGAYLDRAIALASRPSTVLCTFGDLLRVPSASRGDLFAARAAGADVRTVLSPLQALEIAAANPASQVVFLAIGFETTAPANALAVELARRRHLPNFSLLCAQYLIPPVLRAVCAIDPPSAPHAFLAPGHVCAVTGSDPYRPLAAALQRPIVVTGFSPSEILLGVYHALRLLAFPPPDGVPPLFNAYPSVVRPAGNPAALDLLHRVFRPVDASWRGLGSIPASGLALRPEFADFDADLRFAGFFQSLENPPELFPIVGKNSPKNTPFFQSLEKPSDVFPIVGKTPPPPPSPPCPAADVLLGRLSPDRCPHFSSRCTPEHPLGAPMVSPEGACAAFHLHRPPR